MVELPNEINYEWIKRGGKIQKILFKKQAIEMLFQILIFKCVSHLVLEICIFANLLLIPSVILILIEFSVMLFLNNGSVLHSGSSSRSATNSVTYRISIVHSH